MKPDFFIQRLQNGETVTMSPRGNSMTPRIYSGQKITISPITPETEIKKNDIAFCKVGGRIYVHLISAIQGDRYQISNNHGHVNGWTTREKLYGLVTAIG